MEKSDQITSMPIRKRTLVKGTEEICEAVACTCSANHTHGKTDGSMTVNGKTVRVAEWSGGYSKAFATKVVIGAEKFLVTFRSATERCVPRR